MFRRGKEQRMKDYVRSEYVEFWMHEFAGKPNYLKYGGVFLSALSNNIS